MARKLDKETKDVMSEQEKVAALIEHEGWGYVRARFLAKAASMVNLMDITTPNAENIIQLIGSRQLAAASILEILSEVEGTAEQFKANQKMYMEKINGEFILRHTGHQIGM